MTPVELDIVRHAIRNKTCLSAKYHGFMREFCPHSLGHASDGKYHLLGFQFGGGSRSGLSKGGDWRCMEVSALTQVCPISGDWHTGHGHSRPNSCVTRIELEVSH